MSLTKTLVLSSLISLALASEVGPLAAAIEFLKKAEGYSATPYQDTRGC